MRVAKIIEHCPFCGCEAILVERILPKSALKVKCPECHVFMARKYEEDGIEEAYNELMARWNRRDGFIPEIPKR